MSTFGLTICQVVAESEIRGSEEQVCVGGVKVNCLVCGSVSD